jgi:creatinine amidohydrolase
VVVRTFADLVGRVPPQSPVDVVNGHGGNYVLSSVVQEANERERRMALFPSRSDWDAARFAAEMETTGHEDMHAGELETSLLLSSDPEVVRSSVNAADHDASERPLLLTQGMQGCAPSGIIGRPSLASAEKGKIALVTLVERFGAHMEALI